MAEIESIKSARQLLKASLEKSKEIATALDGTETRLKIIKQSLNIPFCVKPRSIFSFNEEIVRAVNPIFAARIVHRSVRELEKSLLSIDPHSDLSAYLSVMRKLEEGLKFLANNCELAIQWLQDINLDQFQELSISLENSNNYLLNMNKYLRILEELRAIEKSSYLGGGILNAAFDRLESEFRWLLKENRVLTGSVIEHLKSIVEKLNANNRLKKCISLFVEVRVSNTIMRLQALDLDYLDIHISDFDDMQSIGILIEEWEKHFEFTVKDVYEFEYKLCNDVFEKTESEIRMKCFGRIALGSGVLSFLQFAKNVVIHTKRDPIKLLKLLEIFDVLNNLRSNFNRLFAGTDCSEIRNMTRDLISEIVNGACDIFFELPIQVQSQRQCSPPSNGGIVPKLVSFVTEYCNKLLDDYYRRILTQVLEIHQSWKEKVYDENTIVVDQFYSIMKEIALNLDSWSKSYEDISLSYLFMMSNHSYLCNLRGTKLGDMMGDSWLRAHEEYKDYYATIYLKKSWGSVLVPLLSYKCFLSKSFCKANEQDVDNIIIRLKEFNECFEERYKKQSHWVIVDESLRQKVCQLLVQTVVPVYKNYLWNYKILVEQDSDRADKYVQYSVESLENMLTSMFKPRLNKSCSTKNNSHLFCKIKNVVTNQFCIK